MTQVKPGGVGMHDSTGTGSMIGTRYFKLRISLNCISWAKTGGKLVEILKLVYDWLLNHSL